MPLLIQDALRNHDYIRPMNHTFAIFAVPPYRKHSLPNMKALVYHPLFMAGLVLLAPAFVHAGTKESRDTRMAWPVSSQDVIWDSPSTDAKGSMPLGNGDIGLNVWIEPAGDLVLLVAKTDSFDEFNRLLKIGRIRVRTTPALFHPGMAFSQALRLADGAIEIKSGDTSIRVWVDANHPVAQVDLKSATPVEMQVMADNWRTENRALADDETSGPGTAWGNWPDKMRVNADTLMPKKNGQIGWCHHNVESQWKRNLELTALGAEVAKGKDPVMNRSFGALVRAAGATAVSDTELKTVAPTKNFTLRILTTTGFACSPQDWERSANSMLDKVVRLADTDRFVAHQAWWCAFWNRSWVKIDALSGGAALPTNAHTWKLGADSLGGSRFGGEIAGASVSSKALDDREIAALTAAPRPETSATIKGTDSVLGDTCTLAAWIKPAAGESGRILDKCTVGQPDGFTFDTYPSLSLRWIVGNRTLMLPNCLKAGEWQHVAARVDASGELALYLNGKQVSGKQLKADPPLSIGESVTRAYTLQRFVTACSGRGGLPIKFNGSIFTVEGHDPDYRKWGSGYWWQNTRLPYWTMLYAGDYEMMKPLFDMYLRALPLREAATKKYYHHAGAFFPETIYFWGNYMDDANYGTDRTGKEDGMCDNTFIRRYWQSGLELVAMMLDYYDGTQDTAFRDQTLLPLAKSITTFYDQHWPRVNGKIVFEPAQSLETMQIAKNPMPEVVGQHYLLPRLLKLPVDEATKAAWNQTLADLPPVPIGTTARYTHDANETGPFPSTEIGSIRLLPAETYSAKRNFENTELYGVFPYRLFTAMAGKESLALALNAWRVRLHPEDFGWQQNCIQAALLGLANEAKVMVAARATATATGYRFPAFFGPNYDWTPDQDHPSSFVIAVQRMLMQCEGDKIALLPAWPADWSASFKLHAPKNTTIECRVEKGAIVELKVTPESRRKDIILPAGK